MSSAVVLVAMLAGGPDASASFAITEYPVPTTLGAPWDVALGSDGNVWFTEELADKVGRITPAGTVTEYPLPSENVQPEAITAGPDGNLWFVELSGNAIGRITPSGTITEFPIPTAHAGPAGIAAGPDGRLWFTEAYADAIGRITTSGTFLKRFKLPTTNAQPNQITAGPDGNLWFTETIAGNIGRITPTGAVTEFPIGVSNTSPRGIAPGKDGNLWFSDLNNDAIGRVTTSGTVTEFPITAGAAPDGITPGPDGDLWYTEIGASAIGQVSTTGTPLTESPTPTPSSQPNGISPGSDGNIWFAEENGSIGKLELPNLNIFNVYYVPNRFFIPNITKVSARGDTVNWLMLAPGTRGIADTTGLDLYGYSQTGAPIATPIGGTFSYAYDWAGSYTYDDPFHPGTQGRVSVPISVARVVGATGAAQITWGSADPPAGDVFDVLVEQPGSTNYAPWHIGTTTPSASFGPSDPLWTRAGTYRFKARLRTTTSSAASGYSAPQSINLH